MIRYTSMGSTLPGAEAALPSSLPVLAVVVITRNEEQHIGMCLSAVLRAVQSHPGTRVVVVDSDSDDATATIAAQFPVEVYRYHSATRTAAAGRFVGTQFVSARYILFVDGDSQIEAAWLPSAIDLMERYGQVGVVFGRRREIYEGVSPAYKSALAADEKSLGGNALYRRSALLAAGGFNPYLTSEEEGELRGRLEAAGYKVTQTPELMFTHYTVPKDTWHGQVRRIRRRMMKGSGQVLRAAIPRGLFWYHARRLNRHLVMLAYVALGIASVIAVSTGLPLAILQVWVGVGIFAFAGLWYRRGCFRSATYIVSDWTLGAIGLVMGFLAPLPDPHSFAPVIEPVSLRAGGPADQSQDVAQSG
ncbi:MAG: glycosyltransferase [Candidatus Binatia bacterium]